ncbi:MAG: pyruvate dehydrogenase (acetyl-transferring) E1 component subunit alpha [Deltaproteobacteria bacterium]|nr:pyruvate dehydrogenase (acetyl-transferring) E1 component subunit alpha [Deltaproteobacteria bacterium]
MAAKPQKPQANPGTEHREKRGPDAPPPIKDSQFARQAPANLDRVSLPDVKVDVEELTRLYRQMQLIRRVEEEAARAYAQGKIGGFLHLYIGQESVGVGAAAALRPGDYVVGTYRDHGLAIAKGMSARAVMAELFGKVTGCSKGLGGSMHLFDAPNGMLGGYGIVGGHIPLAVGCAFASKYRGDGRVTLCFFGEGSVTIGSFHEALSLAALWRLPIVFVCENNEYAMGTPLARTLSVEDVSQKALAYGMPRDRFFARDVLEVKQRLGEAIERARETSEPTLVEVRTYRFRGHSMSDPGKYRTSDEIEAQKKLDPMLRARAQLELLGKTAEQLSALDAEIEEEVQDAVRFAAESEEPGPELLEPMTYVGPFAR